MSFYAILAMDYKLKFKTGKYKESVLKLQKETFSSATLWPSCEPMKRCHTDTLKVEWI